MKGPIISKKEDQILLLFAFHRLTLYRLRPC
jgi:hypothetical protein